ncbi:MAG: CotH kinase family protein [Ruminococcus sp.]
MKTVKKGFSRGLSILLTLLMVLSLTVVGMVSPSAADVTLTETGKTFTDGEYIYIKNFSTGSYNWILADSDAWLHLWKEGSSGELDVKFELCAGNAGEVGSYYRAQVTSGEYDRIIFTRNSSGSTGPWNNKLHQTGNMTVDSTNNCYTGFSADGTSYSSEMYNPTGGGTGDITISDGKDTHIIIDRGNCGDYTNVNPYIYAWKTGTNNELTGAWRGTLSTKQDGLFFVGFDDPGQNFSFIVSDSDDSPKTPDIDVTYQGAGDYYYKLADDGKSAESVKFVAYSGGGETTTMRTFAAGDMLYIVNGKPADSWNANWVASDANVKITLTNSKTGATTTTENVTLVSGEAYAAGAVYGASIPTGGEYDQIKIERTANNNDKHSTGTMTLNANDNYNCFADFKVNGTTYTGSVYDSSVVIVSGFYVDMTPGDDTFTDDHIKPTVSGSTYTLYLPSGIDRTKVTIVHGYGSLTIGGAAVTSGQEVDLSSGSYQLGGDVSGTLRVYKSQNVSSIHTTTGVAMPQQKGLYASKEDYSTSGTIVVFDKNGNQVNTDITLKKIKGRGNSSWKASNELIGKYAFNITLAKGAKLLDESAAAKKYCLVSYNADEARMRNMVVYELSQQIGLNFSPDYEPVDLYNNGVYVGSYLLTDKVEIGNPLVDIVNLDKANEAANLELYAASDITSYRGSSNGNINDNSTKGYKKWVNMTEIEASVYAESGFLLEFELNERFADEISGFISNKGQQIVVKYPEYTSKNQIDFISQKWADAEALMYNKDATYEQLSAVIDVESFARMYLIQEFTKNLDGCATSFYVYYDEGRFHAGPVWDYDWTLGQYAKTYTDRVNQSSVHNSYVNADPSNSDGWYMNSKTIYGASTLNAQAALCQNEAFWSAVKAEWNENFYDAVKAFTTGTVTNTSGLTGTLAAFYDQVKYSTAMDETKWSIIANDPMASWGSNNTGNNHDEATVFLNNWIYDRQQWMDDYLGIIRSQSKTGIYKVDYVIQPPKVTTDKQSYTAGEDVTLTITDVTGGNYTYTIYKDGVELATGVTENTYVDTAVTGTSARYEVVAHTTTVTSDKSSAKSAPAEIEITSLKLAITGIEAPTTAMVGDTLNIKVQSNAGSFNDITGLTYKLTYGTQELENSTGVFSVPVTSDMVNSAYAFTAQVSATVGGELQNASQGITVNISDYQMTLSVKAPATVEVGSVVTITASANSNSTVTYQLYDITGGAETLVESNTNGVFTVDIPSDAEVGSTKSYKVVASTTVEGTEYSKTSEFTFTVSEVTDAYSVVVYFKSADSYGYRPLLTTTGAVNDANRYSMQRYEVICKNVTQTASYSWYKSEGLTVSKSSGQLVVNVVSSRYAMEGEIALNLSNYTANEGVIEVYLACDNLNFNPGGVIHDLTDNANRNWTQSATNMIYDEAEVSAATYAAVASMIAPRLVGDVNNDGVVNVKDATLLQKSIAGTATLDADSRYISDVFYDGTISVKDATAIQKRVVNL